MTIHKSVLTLGGTGSRRRGGTVAAIFAAITIVLFSTLSTIASFLYNAAAGMTGGVEITLGERS